MATLTQVKNDVTYACAPAPYPPPLKEDGGLRSNDNDRGAFVMTTLDRIWQIGCVPKAFEDNEAVVNRSEKEGTTVISYCFLDPNAESDAQKKVAIVEGMKEWEKYANVSFVEHPQEAPAGASTADIRISFRTTSGSSWSAVGATKRGGVDMIPAKKPTINFGVLTDGKSLNETAIVLHELGHILGMMHEHQSPARGVKITLKTEEVYKYYRPLLGFNDRLVKTQIIDEYKQGESNFSRFDSESIMMYFMPAHLNVENIQIRPNTKLSGLDKAYIQLAYPHNDSGRLLSAMGTIGVPESEAMKIIEPISICASSDQDKKDAWWKNNKGNEDPEKPQLKHFLRAVRMEFFDYNKRNIEAQALLRAKKRRAGAQEPLKESGQLTTTQAQGVESVDNTSAPPSH